MYHFLIVCVLQEKSLFISRVVRYLPNGLCVLFLGYLKFVFLNFQAKINGFLFTTFKCACYNIEKKYTRENVNNLYLKIAYFIAQSEIFITAKLPKTSPNLIFCSMAHRGTYVV